MKNLNYSAIILGAGTSTRFLENKQTALLCGKPVFYYSLSFFIKDKNCLKIILVLNKENKQNTLHLIKKLSLDIKKVSIVNGGDTRFKSCLNAISYVSSDKVIIQDAARPLIKKYMIEEIVNSLDTFSSAIIYSKPINTIKDVSQNLKTLKRNDLICSETPQGFKTDIIKEAYLKAGTLVNHDMFDDSMVLETYDPKIETKLILSKNNNIKITYPNDIKIAEIFLKI